jgi:hypothetical protein
VTKREKKRKGSGDREKKSEKGEQTEIEKKERG